VFEVYWIGEGQPVLHRSRGPAFAHQAHTHPPTHPAAPPPGVPRGLVPFAPPQAPYPVCLLYAGPPAYPVYAGARSARAFENLRALLSESQRHF
jgi:hypothetical protein